MKTKNPFLGDVVRCGDTGTVGRVTAFRNGLPVVTFNDGAVGVCTHAIVLGGRKS